MDIKISTKRNYKSKNTYDLSFQGFTRKDIACLRCALAMHAQNNYSRKAKEIFDRLNDGLRANKEPNIHAAAIFWY